MLRITFDNSGTSGAAKVRQENSYYAFGLVMPGSVVTTPTNPNKHLYNGGSEWQNDFNNLPDYYQTFNRNYDAALGRWIGVDPVAEGAESMSSYQYAGNNPVLFNDPLGDKNKLPPPEFHFTDYSRFNTNPRLRKAMAEQDTYGYGLDLPFINSGGGWGGSDAGGGEWSAYSNTGWDGNFSNFWNGFLHSSSGQTLSQYMASYNGNNHYAYGINSDGESLYMQSTGVDQDSYWLGTASSSESRTYDTWTEISKAQYEKMTGTGESSSSNTASGRDQWVGTVNVRLAIVFGEAFLDSSPSTNVNSGSFVTGMGNLTGTFVKNNVENTPTIVNGLKTAQLAEHATKGMGVTSALLTTYEAISDHGRLTWGDDAKIGIGILATFVPYGWIYSAVDIGVAIGTGKSVTDRVGSGVDAVQKYW